MVDDELVPAVRLFEVKEEGNFPTHKPLRLLIEIDLHAKLAQYLGTGNQVTNKP